MENSGILYVFPVFHSAWMAKKISFPVADDLFRVSLIGAVVGSGFAGFQSLGQLHNPGGAQTGSSQLEELLCILQAGNAAGGLDLHMGCHVPRKKLHIVEGGAGGGEAGG